eukprot:CAMPEP_0168551498 /NCGR_PEP_ID=MMETSP0413-20121227/6205_1 /TAXON_ID=136452 /ORGANISM="Filamoeba nolandi, Strain NC-AS-23-1" /LENGTH=495 /DNA_ID=CAMNT_0008582029 /DNA_START=57 /DNA_END=1544 /DNA_ORIENTATION=-
MLKVKVSPKLIKPIQPSRFFSSQSKPLGRQDVVVVGGGVGGYVAAIKASQLGLKTTCVEYRGALGGTCLNVGCIPSKSLLNSSHKYEELKHLHQVHGIKVDNFSVDLPQMMKMKDSRVKGLTSGVESLFLKYKVNYVRGKGRLTNPNQVAVELNNGGTQIIDTENIIIATGSEVASLPTIKIDEKKIISSTGALSLSEVPKKLIVIGGGIIGLELGSVWSRLGSEVTVIEFTGRIAAGADPEVATELQKILAKQGLKFQMNTKVCSAVYNDKGTVTVTMEDAKGGNQQTLEADVVLVSVGRKPYTEGLGLQEVGVKTSDKGFILVNSNFRTNIPSIRAIGDCIGGPMLAHKAEDEGVSVAEDLVSPGTAHIDYNTVPSVIYTWPEVSWVGQTEEELKKKNIPYKIGKFPFIGNSRARTNADAVGFVKFLADAQTDKLLGAHIIGPNAGELIHEAVLAIEYGASAEDIGRTSHAHPTLSEAVKEAAMSTYDKPIHF